MAPSHEWTWARTQRVLNSGEWVWHKKWVMQRESQGWGSRQSTVPGAPHSSQPEDGTGGGRWSREVEGPGTEQELARESRGGRRLSSRVFVNGRVWGFHFLYIPDEQGTVTTAEGGEMLQELVSGDTWHLWMPFNEPLLCVSNPRGVCFHFVCCF